MTSDNALLLYPAVFKLLLHFFTISRYGYFRDELYFIACSEHLAWGYVDMAPMVAWVAALSRWLLGDSLFAIRFFPVVAGAVFVWLTGLIARELGGGREARFLGQVTVIVAPVYLVIDSFLSMNAFEEVLWPLAAYLVMRIINTGNQKLWLWFGIVAGAGLLTKHSMLFFGSAVFVGLLLTPERKAFAQRWIWIGGAIALVIFLPNLLWQFQHGWPTIELLRNVKETGKNVVLSPPVFLFRQAFMLNFFTLPVWVAGLWFFFFHQMGKQYRVLGWAYLVLLATFIVLEAKDYYVAPFYPVLMAAGGVVWEPLLKRRKVVFATATVVLAASGVLAALLTLPLLPPERYLKLMHGLGITPPRSEVSHTSELPQHLADQFGWVEMVEKVAAVYQSLPADERAKACIFAGNYGQAGAIDFFGGRYGLPKAISGHQNYFLWGPRDCGGEVLITVGEKPEDVRKSFAEVVEAV
ncbi:MAG: glycosyltransferase family 39 protein, partial [Chloroflexota bacterium]